MSCIVPADLRTALATLLLLFSALAPAIAAEAPLVIELPGQPPAVQQQSLRAPLPTVDAEIRLRNTATDPKEKRTFRLGGLLVRKSDGLARPAEWRRVSTPTESDTIDPGTELTLRLAAELPLPGSYEVAIDSFAPRADGTPGETADRRIQITVERGGGEIASDFLAAALPVQSGWPALHADHILIKLHNSGTEPAYFEQPQVLAFYAKNGDAQTNLPVGTPPHIDSSACPSPLAPKTSCSATLFVKSRPTPGEYGIEIGVAGVNGGWSTVNQVLRVRAPLLLAFLAIALGTICGAVVQYWRTQGSALVAGFIRIRAQRDQLTKFAPADAAPIIAANRDTVTRDLDRLADQCQAGSDVTAKLDETENRIDRLEVAAALLRCFDQLGDGREELGGRRDAIVAVLVKPAATAEERSAIDARRTDFANDMSAWNAFYSERRSSEALLGAVKALLAGSRHDPELAEETTQCQAAAAAFEPAMRAAQAPFAANPPAAAPDGVQDRRDALRQPAEDFGQAARGFVTAVLEKIGQSLQKTVDDHMAPEDHVKDAEQKLSAVKNLLDHAAAYSDQQLVDAFARLATGLEAAHEAPALAGDAAAPPVPQIDLTGLTALGDLSGKSRAELQAKARRWQLVVNAVIVIATSLTGIVALGNTATWGSWTDLITAFLSGLGFRVVLQEVAGTIASAAPPPKA